MGKMSAQATEIAEIVQSTLTALSAVYASPPAQLETFCAVVAPAPDWGTYEGATFCGPRVSWEVLLVAGMNDFTAAMDWLYEQVELLAAVLDIASWSQPELLDLGGGGSGIAVRVRLAPQTLEVT